MYLNARFFPTTGYARVLLFMFIRRELGGTGTGCLFQLGGTGTGCLFQFTYCEIQRSQATIPAKIVIFLQPKFLQYIK